MLAQQRVEFACKKRGKAQHLATFSERPFAVGAGEDEETATIRVLCRADDLRLFAPHQIWRIARALGHEAWHEVQQPASLEAVGHKPLGELGRTRRAGQIGSLNPALPARDHARGEHRHSWGCFQPIAGKIHKRALKIAITHGQNAICALAPFKNPALGIDAKGAQRTRAPVKAN